MRVVFAFILLALCQPWALAQSPDGNQPPGMKFPEGPKPQLPASLAGQQKDLRGSGPGGTGEPTSPYYKPGLRADDASFNTQTLKAMPEFSTIPAYPGKPVKFMNGNIYPGPGKVQSVSFEVGQPLKAVYSWYVESLKLRGFKIDEQNLGYSAHMSGRLPEKNCSIDIQLLTLKDTTFKTRVHLKEVNLQDVPVEKWGGTKKMGEPMPKPQWQGH